MTPRQHKYLLDESQMPTSWYNIIPDLPSPPPPPLHPGTHQPVGPDDLAPLFPMDLILQEVSTERYIPIPDEVQDIYRLWRPSPLYRAHRLEKALGTPARIYYKYEGVSPAGSHKPNTAVPQVYYNAKAGVKKLTTETGAGQWGTALAFACSLVRRGMRGVAGRCVLRRQALPADPDRDVRRHRAPLAVAVDLFGSLVPRRSPRLAGHRHLRGGRGGGRRTGHQVRAGFGAEPRAAAPDDHRRGGAAAAGDGRRIRRRPGGRLHRRRLQLRGSGVPVPPGEARRPAEPGRSARWNRRPARR